MFSLAKIVGVFSRCASVICLCFIFVGARAVAEDAAVAAEAAPAKDWTLSHESELSVVKVGGNTESDNFSAKQKTTYKRNLNSFIAAAGFLQTKSGSEETALKWDASLRYERELSAKWAAFVQYGTESDKYAGYTQRDNADLGGKYTFIKTDKHNLNSEAGFRQTETLSSATGDRESSESARLYSEYSRNFTETVSGKFWVEYLPNLDESSAWLLNYEPSLSVMLSNTFSLKTAYLVKRHNKTVTPGEDKNDTTFLTSLVAKF